MLGDLLCAVPALRALRHALPSADITLLGLPWTESFCRRFSRYIDGFVEFVGYPGSPEIPVAVEKFPDFLKSLNTNPWDLVIQMHGSGLYVNSLITLFRAEHHAGFYQPGLFTPDERYFVEYPNEGHEIDRLLLLMTHLGATARGRELEFPIAEDETQRARALLREYDLEPGDFVCIHPGSRSTDRRLPIEHFERVARYVANHGYKVVVTGTREEQQLTAQLVRQCTCPVVDLTGRTQLGEIGEVIRNSRLLVCNDTGVSHIAAALCSPSIVIFTGSDPTRWAPLDAHLHRIVVARRDTGERGKDVHRLLDVVSEVLSTGEVHAA